MLAVMSELKSQCSSDVVAKHVQSRMAFVAADDMQDIQTLISSCAASSSSTVMHRLALEMLNRPCYSEQCYCHTKCFCKQLSRSQ